MSNSSMLMSQRHKNNWRLRLGFAVVILAIIGISGVFLQNTLSVQAVQTVPYKINFQGRLTDSAGNAMANGDYNVKFRLYDAATAGTVLWTETRETTNRVTLTNGLFSVQLGDVTALSPSVFTQQPLYFEVELPTPATATCSTAACATFNGTEIMTPRRPLGASPYAMNSDTLDGVDGASFARRDADNTFTGTQLFKNGTDSTTALRVQNSAGAIIFNVDSTNQRVSIGSTLDTGAKLYTFTNTRTNLHLRQTGTSDIFQAQNGTTDVFVVSATGEVLSQNSTDSATAFVVKNAIGTSFFSVDTQNSVVKVGAAAEFSGSVRVGDATNGLDLSSTGVTIRGSARPTRIVNLVPEYQGATFTADGTANIGSLSSDFCSGTGRLSINSMICSVTTEEHNYYQWTTAEATVQDYDLYVRYKVPADYDTGSMTDLKITGWGTTTTTEKVDLTLYSPGSATACSTASAVTLTAAWATATVAAPLGACTIAAGDTVTFKVHLEAGQNNFARASDIRFNYRSKF